MDNPSNTPLNNGSKILRQKDTKKKRKRLIADTSRGALKIINAEGRSGVERRRVYNALEQLRTATSRSISIALNMESSNVIRCLAEIEKAGRIQVPFRAKCPITGIIVKHYCNKINWRRNDTEV